MKAADPTLVDLMHGIALEGFEPRYGEPGETFGSEPLWRRVGELGSRLWLDSGDVEAVRRLWTREMTALTTNNSLLNTEVQRGHYDELIRTTASRLRREVPGLSEEERIGEIGFVINARHALGLVSRFDAYVSVELHTDLAHDAEGTVAYGLRYHAVCPERFIVKVPLTAEGLLAARRLAAERVPVNLTLGFSARQNVLAAVLAQPAYCNVFLGRLNQLVADNGLGDGENVGERAVASSQRVVAKLRSELNVPTRQIAASLRSGQQVAALLGVDVLTMPPKAAEQFLGIETKPKDLQAGIEDQFDIRWTDDGEARALGVDAFWQVPLGLESAIRRLTTSDMEILDARAVRRRLEVEDFGTLLPDWAEQDVFQARLDGKLPRLDVWRDRLEAGEIALDALMTLHGLEAFAHDQLEMDERIRRLMQA